MRNRFGQFVAGSIPINGFKSGVSTWNKGKKMSFDFSKKISERMKLMWLDQDYRLKMSKKHSNKLAELSSRWKGGKIEEKCKFCSSIFMIDRYRKGKAKFCSHSCRAKSKTGTSALNWRGGVTDENKKIRSSEEYNNWRKSVYKRDCWTCQKCMKKQKHPIAHHIKSFKDFIELRFDVSNGITLCRSCHKKVHTEIGRSTQFGRVFDATNGVLTIA